MQISDLSNLDNVWSGFSDKARNEYRKAEKRNSLHIDANPSLDAFLELNKMVFQRQGLAIPYADELVRRIDKACSDRNCRAIFIARDEKGNPHAGLYLIWDENSAYYLMGGGDPELRNSGATSFCMWEAIKFASTVTRVFDFEGSMLEPVEKFFRSFGAHHVPYSAISKFNGRHLRVAHSLIGALAR